MANDRSGVRTGSGDGGFTRKTRAISRIVAATLPPVAVYFASVRALILARASMLTSARPRTLVLIVSDVVIDVAMLGPRGNELGPRQVVPLTSESATLWQAISALGEFDRITVIGADLEGIGAQIAHQSQRPVRQMSYARLHWNRVISGRGVELALVLAPRLAATLYHDGVEVPGLELGSQLARKDKRYREYLAPRVLEKKGREAWVKRMTRSLREILAVWNPTKLYVAVPPELPMPDELPPQVVVVPVRDSVEDALLVWEPARIALMTDAELRDQGRGDLGNLVDRREH